MGAKPNPNRRADIKAALKRVKPDQELGLDELAHIYGATKGPFVTAKKQMVGFPAPILRGTSHFYNGRAALQAMLDYDMRNDAAAQQREKRAAAILGTTHREREEAAAGFNPRDLQILNRMATEVEERERAQRMYIPAAEVSAIAGEVFSSLSEFMAGLSNKVDPNGLLDARLRNIIDKEGHDALLGFHRRLAVLLDADVEPAADRAAPSGARKPRTRRKRA